MPTFNVTTYSSAARSLLAGETGYIGRTGELVTSGAVAITVAGSANVIVHGVLASLTNSTLASSGAIADLDLLVGSTGDLTSTAASGVTFDAVSVARVSNAGTIQGVATAVRLGASDGDADLFLVNTGTIATVSADPLVRTVTMDAGSGDVTFDNAGTIGGTAFFTAMVLLSGDEIVFSNSGTVSGGVFVDGDSFSSVTNTGTVAGSISASNGLGGVSVTNTGTVTGEIVGTGLDDVYRGTGVVGREVRLGDGDDVYVMTRYDVQISEVLNAGTDTVETALDWTLGANFENLTLRGARDATGTGNGLDNTIRGNDGDNLLRGRRGDDFIDDDAGDDTLLGGDGDDLLTDTGGDNSVNGGAGSDTLWLFTGSNGGAVTVNLAQRTATGTGFANSLDSIENVIGSTLDDVITGSGVANLLDGDSGNDTLLGGKGADTLAGGTGRDTLTGGTEGDVFLFSAIGESAVATPDRITDFVRGQDIIDLSAIDADGAAAGNGTFTFLTGITIPLGQGSVQVVQDAAANVTKVNLRIAGDTSIDGVIELSGLLALTAADFVL